MYEYERASKCETVYVMREKQARQSFTLLLFLGSAGH